MTTDKDRQVLFDWYQSSLLNVIQEANDRLDNHADHREVVDLLTAALFACEAFEILPEGIRVAFREAMNRANGTAVPLEQMTTP